MPSLRFATPLRLLLALAALPGCGFSDAYVKATSSFADASVAGARAFDPEFQTASFLCRRRSQYDFLQKRLQPGTRWGNSPYWSDWHAAQPINPSNPGSETWQAHCQQIEQVEKVYRKSLVLLSAYSVALVELSKTGNYTGSDVRDAARSAGEIAVTLGAAPLVGSVMSGIGLPLTQLADLLFQARTQRQMRKSIEKADPIIRLILEALTQYAKSTDAELRDAEFRLRDLLVTLEIRVGAYHPARLPGAPLATGQKDEEPRKPSPVDPVHVIEYYRFAVTEDESLRLLRNAQDTYIKILDSLDKAHRALAEAGQHPRKQGMEDLKRVLGFTSDALREAAALKPFLNP